MPTDKVKTQQKKKKGETKIIAFTPPEVYVSKEKKNLIRDAIVKLFVNALPQNRKKLNEDNGNEI